MTATNHDDQTHSLVKFVQRREFGDFCKSSPLVFHVFIAAECGHHGKTHCSSQSMFTFSERSLKLPCWRHGSHAHRHEESPCSWTFSRSWKCKPWWSSPRASLHGSSHSPDRVPPRTRAERTPSCSRPASLVHPSPSTAEHMISQPINQSINQSSKQASIMP